MIEFNYLFLTSTFYLLVEELYFMLNNVNIKCQIPIAVDMAKDSSGKDRDLKKRLENDYYFSCAIEECYASFKNIIRDLVQGEPEKRYGLEIIYIKL